MVEEFCGPFFWEESTPALFDDHGELKDWAAEQTVLNGHLLFRTSGSSGVRKWIALSKSALKWSAESVICHLGMTSDDVCGLALPVHHVGGFGVVARCYFSGARLARFNERWSPQEFWKFCNKEKVTLTSLVPTQVSDLVSMGLSGPLTLRRIIVGGGHLEDELKEKARALGWPVVPSYGMTETASQIATGDELPLIEGWCARIVDDLLELRGEGLLTGVITETKEGFHFADPKVDGWFRTSDYAELHDGKLAIRGRADRRVKVLGELIDLDTLEKFWSDKTGGEAALIARPDDRCIHTLHLFFTGNEEEISMLNMGLPGPERLARWHHVSELPRTSLGKIDRWRLTNIQFD